jgi:hypothetical protein
MGEQNLGTVREEMEQGSFVRQEDAFRNGFPRAAIIQPSRIVIIFIFRWRARGRAEL